LRLAAALPADELTAEEEGDTELNALVERVKRWQAVSSFAAQLHHAHRVEHDHQLLH
jgi:hypothetical protein